MCKTETYSKVRVRKHLFHNSIWFEKRGCFIFTAFQLRSTISFLKSWRLDPTDEASLEDRHRFRSPKRPILKKLGPRLMLKKACYYDIIRFILKPPIMQYFKPKPTCTCQHVRRVSENTILRRIFNPQLITLFSVFSDQISSQSISWRRWNMRTHTRHSL
jgi:hypothetical protein